MSQAWEWTFKEVAILFYKFLKTLKSPCFIFQTSLRCDELPEDMKMTKITPVFKGENRLLAKNSRLISILTTLYKMLKRMMHNGIFRSLTENKVPFLKYFGWQNNTSTNYFKVSSRYYSIFWKEKNVLGVSHLP